MMFLRLIEHSLEAIPDILFQIIWEAATLLRRVLISLPLQVRTLISTLFVWFVIRLQVDTFWTWFQWNIWFYASWTIGHDEARLSSGIDRIERVTYGSHRLEKLHKLTPDAEHRQQTSRQPRCLLYIHGGGFVFASSAVLLQSTTSFVRQGYTVYSIDYPLAPDDRFPAALISTIRALHWIRVHEGVAQVVVLGDSAGASLAAMAAAIIVNPKLLQEFSTAVKMPELVTWQYPAIRRLGLLYGLLDQTSWRGRQLKQISMLENLIAEGGIAGCIELYRNLEGVFDNKLSLMDIVNDIEVFPRTLFIGGSRDPLVYSTIVAHEALASKGLDVHCKIFPARHGFHGFPVEWTFGAWKFDAQPASQLLIHFFSSERKGHGRSCSWFKQGVGCCLVEQGDFGLHALRAVDKAIGNDEGVFSSTDSIEDAEDTISAAEMLATTQIIR